jgi:hypothetical protein
MYKQFTVLKVKKSFSMRNNNKGRLINALVGDLFYVTNPEYAQVDCVMVDRKSKAKINSGYLLAKDDIVSLFDVV